MPWYAIIAWLVVGGVAGFCLCAVYACKQIDSLHLQLDSKADFWCKDCEHLKRLKSKTSQLVDRESYIKMLEDRVDRLQRSNAQLGAAVQRRVWKKVQA